MDKIMSFDTFKILEDGEPLEEDYKKIPLHMCFAVKWDGRHKARLVAGGNHTSPGETDDFAGVVSNEAVCIGLLLAALNDLDLMVGDVGNAYLHAFTTEKVYSIAGPEFGELQGKRIKIVKSLYGLRSSHIRWRNFISDDLRDMGFTQSRVDADLWYRDTGTHYEYIDVYVDDILVFSKRAQQIMQQLQQKYPMKGVGRPEIYLGGNMGFHEGTNTLYMSAEKYTTNMVEKLETMFERSFRSYKAPMDPEYHPENDTSAFLGEEDHAKYRMMVGSTQWAITLGRFDIAYTISTLARYSALPRQGHMDAMIRVFGYLKKTKGAKILFDPRQPDYSSFKFQQHKWEGVYAGAREEIDPSFPTPKGKPVTLTIFVDADHARDKETRRSVTGILEFMNCTPIR